MKLSSHKNWVSSVSWSPSNMYTLATAGYDSKIKIWDIRSNTPLHTLQGTETSEDQVTDLKIMDLLWVDDLLLSGGEEKKVRIHRITK